MKFLIYAGCIFVFELFRTFLNRGGLYLGAIPTFLFYGAMFYVADKMSDKWAKSNLEKKAANAGMTPGEYAKKDIPKAFLLEIEHRIKIRDGLSGYLNMCVKEKIITKAQAEAILNDAQNAR